jgi:hypothetical protein
LYLLLPLLPVVHCAHVITESVFVTFRKNLSFRIVVSYCRFVSFERNFVVRRIRLATDKKKYFFLLFDETRRFVLSFSNDFREPHFELWILG